MGIVRYPITRRQILDSSKLKEFADDNFKFDENGRKLSKEVESTVGKGEIACYEQFLLFEQCFQKACFPGASKGVIVWEWDNYRVKQFVAKCGSSLCYQQMINGAELSLKMRKICHLHTILTEVYLKKLAVLFTEALHHHLTYLHNERLFQCYFLIWSSVKTRSVFSKDQIEK